MTGPHLDVPVIAYARWFSYKAKDFLSENRELWRAIAQTRRLFPERRVRFVADRGLDDQKLFGQMRQAKAEFIIRASHLNRSVEVRNDRLGDTSPAGHPNRRGRRRRHSPAHAGLAS